MKKSNRPKASARREPVLVAALILAVFGLLAAGCETRVNARPVGFAAAFSQVENGGLAQLEAGSGEPEVLRRLGLESAWRQDRAATLAELNHAALDGSRPGLLFDLAQLSYAWGHALGATPGRWPEARRHYLQAAVYAWLYLFPPEAKSLGPSPFDGRFRDALTLYSRALALALARGPEAGSAIDLEGGRVTLFGTEHTLPLSTEHFAFPRDAVEVFYPAHAFLLKGLAVRNQIAGVGTPVIGHLRETPGGMVRAVGGSLVLRIEGTLAELTTGGGRLALELRSPTLGTELEIGARRVPVAHDLSAPMAYALSDQKVWNLAFRQFFREREEIPTGVYLTSPHRPGKIPVVFIHGTVSSPVVWANAINTLQADPTIRDHFEFWLFIYRSGYPINYSAVALRTHLRQKLTELRQAGAGTELDRLVLVGHSQGGLLAKLAAVDPGRVLWDAVFNGDYVPGDYSPELQQKLEKGFFFAPVPEVSRVVFLATPHRGSGLAEVWLAGLVRRALEAPQEVLRATAAVVSADGFDRSILRQSRAGVPTSVEDMSPQSSWLLALADLPLRAGVESHSIIATKDGEAGPAASDGVVPYTSAHLEGVDSEKVVRSHHSVQHHPAAIEELRRILLLHLQATRAAADPL